MERYLFNLEHEESLWNPEDDLFAKNPSSSVTVLTHLFTLPPIEVLI